MLNNNTSLFSLFAQINPGLEEILFKELESLGFSPEIEIGGVNFKGGLREIYLANLMLMTPTRVLIRLCEFYETFFSNIPDRIAKYPWEIYINQNISKIRIRATSHKSKLIHSDAIIERVLKGITKRINRELEIKNDQEELPLIIIRVLHDKFTVSIDTSGLPLYKRGYKTFITDAPLRETIAASMILSSGWDGTVPLLDPFCGSGTISFEALNFIMNKPVGVNRDFAFFKWRNFDNSIFNNVKEELILSAKKHVSPEIYAFDIDKKAIKALKENAKLNDIQQLIKSDVKDFRDIIPPQEKGFIITNPPFGIRVLDKKTIDSFYIDFVDVFKDKFKGWKIGILIPNNKINFFKSLSLESRLSFVFGGIRVNFLTGEI
jgi:putative N6-adenine-specific DNA methylase